jgi:hypothetical protein
VAHAASRAPSVADARSKNFAVVGHSYFRGAWLTPFARTTGLGASFNTPRVYDGIAYLAGYASPPALFGVLIADVHDPAAIKPLAFIPCNAGTRCPYLRVNAARHILVFDNDTNRDNPRQPAAGQRAQARFSFYDISNPRSPKPLGFFSTTVGGATHGFDIDGRARMIFPPRPPNPFWDAREINKARRAAMR